MHAFIHLYNKSASSDLSHDEFIAAARELHRLIQVSEMANDKSLPNDPVFVCHLTEFISVPKIEGSVPAFTDSLSKAFFEQTGKTWDSNKYTLVLVPTQVLGNRHFVVFEK